MDTETQIDLARLQAREWQVWTDGYMWGMVQGAIGQRLDDQDLAEFAARLAVAQVEVHADIREAARRARDFIDVAMAREKRQQRIAKPDGAAA